MAHDDTLRLERLLADTERLLPLIRRLVRDEDAARDVLQETRIAALDADGDGRGYLRGIAANLARRWHRGERRRRAHEREAGARRVSAAGEAPAGAERAERLRAVIDAVLALEEPYRSTVALRYLDDRSPSAIAREQGVPVSTVRTRLHRGLDRLRRTLESRHGTRRAWMAAYAPLVRTTAALGWKGVVMSSKGKGIVGVVAALALVGWIVVDRTAPPTAVDTVSDDVTAASEAVERDESAPVLAPAGAAEPTERADSPPPAVAAVAPVDGDDFIAGSVSDAANNPVAGARVEVVHRRVSLVRTETGADGRFRITGLRKHGSEFIVWVTKPGLARDGARVVVGRSRAFRLVAPGVLDVTIVDAVDRTPIGSGELTLWCHDPRTRAMQAIALPVDGAGRVTCADLPPGAFSVGVVSPRHRPITRRWLSIAAGRRTTLVLALSRGRTVEGRVVRASDGGPIVGARVRCGELAPAISDAAGVFRLVGAPARGTVTVDADGFATQQVKLDACAEVRLDRVGTVTGTLHDATGAPIDGVRVSLVNWDRSRRGQATSDARGRFAIAVHGLGKRHVLHVVHGAAVRRVGPFTVDAGMTHDVGAVAVDGACGLDVVVRTASGAPAGDSRVVAESVDTIGKSLAEVRLHGRTDESGRIRFDGVTAGRYRVAAAIQGWPRFEGDPPVVELVAGRSTSVMRTVADVVSVHGVVVDTDGHPIEMAEIASGSAVSGADGRFTLDRVVGSRVAIGATKPGYSRGRCEPFVATAAPPTVTIVLPPLPPLITGRVVDATGAPVERFDVRVHTLPDGWQPGQPVRWSGPSRSCLDPDGRFSFPLREGRWLVEASSAEAGVTVEPRLIEVRCGASAPFVELRLVPGGTVRGRVVTASGAPLARAKVYLLAEGGRRVGRSPRFADADGRFEVRSVPPGRLVVRTRHDDMTDAERVVTVEPGSVTEVEVVATDAAATLRIVARGANGKPIAGARVQIFRPDGTVFPPDTTRHLRAMAKQGVDSGPRDWKKLQHDLFHSDDAGVLVRRFLPPGAYRVEVTHDDYATVRHDVRLVVGEQPLDVTLVTER